MIDYSNNKIWSNQKNNPWYLPQKPQVKIKTPASIEAAKVRLCLRYVIIGMATANKTLTISSLYNIKLQLIYNKIWNKHNS